MRFQQGTLRYRKDADIAIDNLAALKQIFPALKAALGEAECLEIRVADLRNNIVRHPLIALAGALPSLAARMILKHIDSAGLGRRPPPPQHLGTALLPGAALEEAHSGEAHRFKNSIAPMYGRLRS